MIPNLNRIISHLRSRTGHSEIPPSRPGCKLLVTSRAGTHRWCCW